jgi:predicted LPLAT superfamily acyltransferase
MPVPSRLNSFFHFMRFGNAMLDKVASWRGELKLHRDVVFAPGASEALNIAAPQGKLLLASHLGDVEACRALAQLEGSKIINALVFSENAQRFKQIMSEMAPEAGVNLMSVTDIGPDTAIAIKEKLERGEWVAIVGDRIAVNPQRGGEWRVIWSRFMGQPAPFPQGPFILASILRCPVVLIFALRQQGSSSCTANRLPTRCACRAVNASRRCKIPSIAMRSGWSITPSCRRSTGLIFSISGICQSPKRRSKGC